MIQSLLNIGFRLFIKMRQGCAFFIVLTIKFKIPKFSRRFIRLFKVKMSKKKNKETKYLSESELDSFRAFCESKKLKQKDVASLCFEGEDTISIALTKGRFKRAYARLVLLTIKRESDREFKDLEF